MKTLLYCAVLFPLTMGQQSQQPRANVSNRSEPVQVALQKALGKNSSEITMADLATVTELKLPHIHIKSFANDDFVGLTKLKKLHFYSLVHNMGGRGDPIAINERVFLPLNSLEELIILDQLGQLPDGVFSGLVSLKVLDLGNSYLPRLPSSMLTLPKIETVYFAGRGMSKADMEKLKKVLGNKLKNKRTK